MGCNIEEYLDSVYLAGFDFSESGVQERTKEMEQSAYMLKLIEEATETLRKKHKHGEWESDYYYRAENDYVTCLYDSPQLVELEILPNKSGKEQTLEFSFTDYKPLYGAGFCVVQAAK